MVFQGGPKAAAKMLIGLSSAERNKILEQISKKDPQMADLLRKSLFEFLDLPSIGQLSFRQLLKEVSITDIAKVFRKYNDDSVKSFIYENISSGMKSDFEDIINGPKLKLQDLEIIESKIISLIIKKIEQGIIVLSNESNDPMV